VAILIALRIRVVLFGLWAVASVLAQPQEDHSHFEVASIRSVDHSVPYVFAGPATGDPGRISWSRVSLRDLIAAGYTEVYSEFQGAFNMKISGPQWIGNEYSVTATIPPGSTRKDVSQMIRNLVTERFGLKFHDQNKDEQGFELVVGAGGFKLTPSTAGVVSTQTREPWSSSQGHQPGVSRASARRWSMTTLAMWLSSNYTQGVVQVIDKTKIEGLFDFQLLLPAPYDFRASLGPCGGTA
jgi:uncharacterized protein (TIGR03435 family)